MTQTIALPCSDRIIVCADGKTTDANSGIEKLDAPKIFQLTDAVSVTLTGTNLSQPDRLIELTALHIGACTANRGEIDLDIAMKFLQAIVDNGMWKGDGSQDPYIRFTVAGYRGDVPRVGIVESGRRDYGFTEYFTDGAWLPSTAFLVQALQARTYEQIESSEAEQIATSVILRAEAAIPAIVGGKQQMWHVYPDHIDKMSQSYVDDIRARGPVLA